MPTASAYHRAPLMDLAYAPLSDGAVHMQGRFAEQMEQLLSLCDPLKMTSLDTVLATKIGNYQPMPPMPDIAEAMASFREQPDNVVQILRAGAMIALANRDKQGVILVLEAMQRVVAEVPLLTEEALFQVGADLLRLTVDLYRRVGQRFLVTLMKELRSRLPDVSGLLHVFPFQDEYRLQQNFASEEEKDYHARMERFATGKLMADAMSMSAYLSQFSGSLRENSAAKTGLDALTRYHGMSCGAFSADPYLAGKNPARAVELTALCAQVEAYADALSTTGDLTMAEQIETILENVLPDMLKKEGVRSLCPTNRLQEDESCTVQPAEEAEISALLRAFWYIRQSVWLQKDDHTVAYLLPVDGGCITRVDGTPIRFVASHTGNEKRNVTIKVECAKEVPMTLSLRVPSYAQTPMVSVTGEEAVPATSGTMHDVKRIFQNGDEITLTYTVKPQLEVGFRGSVSIKMGATLMALSLPDEKAEWRFALAKDTDIQVQGEEVKIIAVPAPTWTAKEGFILPPPQSLAIGDEAYELTLIPFAGTAGRIAMFPVATAQA